MVNADRFLRPEVCPLTVAMHLAMHPCVYTLAAHKNKLIMLLWFITIVIQYFKVPHVCDPQP